MASALAATSPEPHMHPQEGRRSVHRRWRQVRRLGSLMGAAAAAAAAISPVFVTLAAWGQASSASGLRGPALVRMMEHLPTALDKEDLDTVRMEVETNQVGTFGKHQGKSYRQVLNEVVDTCRCVIQMSEESEASDEMRGFAEFIKRHTSGPGVLVTFGKYKGKPMQHVVSGDPGYCRWVLSAAARPGAGGNLRVFADYIKEACGVEDIPATTPNDGTVSFGRYTGMPMQEVVDEDPSYCQWVLTQQANPIASPGMRAFIEYMNKKGVAEALNDDWYD